MHCPTDLLHQRQHRPQKSGHQRLWNTLNGRYFLLTVYYRLETTTKVREEIRRHAITAVMFCLLGVYVVSR